MGNRPHRSLRLAAVGIAILALVAIGFAWQQDRFVGWWQGKGEATSAGLDLPVRIDPTLSEVYSPDPARFRNVLTRLLPGTDASLSGLQHALHMLGREGRVPLRARGQSSTIVQLLLDSPRAADHFGASQTLCATRHGARFPEYVQVLMGITQPTTEAHPSETLAVLAGVGVPLSQPIVLSKGESTTLHAVLDDTIANFSLEGEIYWKVAALGYYLPPGKRKTWTNKFGQRFTLDDAAEEVLKRPFADSPCGGTHGLITLTILMRADQLHPFFSERTRTRVQEHLASVAKYLSDHQRAEGGWGVGWDQGFTGVQRDVAPEVFPDADALVATSHHLEWMMLLPDPIRPPDEVFRSVAAWMLDVLGRRTDNATWRENAYCPASHAVRGISLLSVGVLPGGIEQGPPAAVPAGKAGKEGA